MIRPADRTAEASRDCRMMELLLAAQRAFRDQMSPFTHDWLSEHQVTSDECYDLSDIIASILMGYLAADSTAKTTWTLRGLALEARRFLGQEEGNSDA